MKKVIDRPNPVNGIGTFQVEDTKHNRTSVICMPSETVILQLDFAELTVCSANLMDSQS